MDLHGAAARAATVLRSKRRWFLAADTDADGICASAVIAIALARAGCGFQVRHSRDKDAAAYQALADVACDGIVLLDKGSSHIALLGELAEGTGRPIVLIDHHGLEGKIPEGVTVVNPRRLGLDGSRDASAATTAAAVALAMDERNIDLAGLALAGAIGDWQHRGGWQGWNQELIEQALESGDLDEREVPGIVGADLADGLTHAHPPIEGLEDIQAARGFLDELGLSGVRDVEELDEQQQGVLLSAVMLQHLQNGADPEALHRLTWSALVDKRLDVGVRLLFRRIDACGRTGAADAGLALLLGDPTAAARVDEAFDAYTQRLGHAIDRLRQEGTDLRQACQVAWTDDPALTGMVGGIGMTHILQDRRRPAVVLAKRPDGDIQVSTRGTNEAVNAGLALGDAVHRAARQIGRDGGGHPVAAGTVIASSDVDTFLQHLDAALVDQGFMA